MQEEGTIAHPAVLPVNFEVLLAERSDRLVKWDHVPAVPEPGRRCSALVFFHDILADSTEYAVCPYQTVEADCLTVTEGDVDAISRCLDRVDLFIRVQRLPRQRFQELPKKRGTADDERGVRVWLISLPKVANECTSIYSGALCSSEC